LVAVHESETPKRIFKIAAQNGDMATLRDFHQQKLEVPLEELYYALRSASQNGQLKVVKFLVEDMKADINYKFETVDSLPSIPSGPIIVQPIKYVTYRQIMGGDILETAAKSNHYKVVEYLVSKGADVRGKSDYVLEWAVKNDHYTLVRTLFENAKKSGNPYEVELIKKVYKLAKSKEMKKNLKQKLGWRKYFVSSPKID